MEIGNYDLRIQTNNIDNISGKVTEIVETMKSDQAISKVGVLTTKTFKAKTENGSEENIKIELGDHSIFPIVYSKGKAPAANDEIAFSTIYADVMSKKVGDDITLVIEGLEKDLTVSGIYSDITNGGKTAKAVFADKENELSDIRRTKMVFVFQQPTMLKNLNILDNVILPSMRDNRKNAEKISEKARVLMKRVGIAELEKRDVTQVSGGQLQRAGIFCFKINDLTGLKYTNDSTRSVMLAEFILRGR